ncbi:Transcription factor SOX-13 [Dispira simplex]|nr:Transcription factor SOX-13 [Dispira simplex]
MSTFNSPDLPAVSDFYSTHLELPSDNTLFGSSELPTTMDFPVLTDTPFPVLPQTTTNPHFYQAPNSTLGHPWGGLGLSLATHDAATNWNTYQYLTNVLNTYNEIYTLTPPQSAHNSPNLLATTTPTTQTTAADTPSTSVAGPVRRNSTASRTRNRSRSESGHIKRPLNPFMIYRQEKQQEFAHKYAGRGIPIGEVSKLIGSMWRKESKATQQQYYDRAEQLKQEHKARYPDYKYNPRKSKQAIGTRRGRANSSAGEVSSVSPPLVSSPNFSILHTPPMQGIGETMYLSPDNHITSLNLAELSGTGTMDAAAELAELQAFILSSLGDQFIPDVLSSTAGMTTHSK